MRRAWAISLTFVFGWMFIAPLLPALLPSAFTATLAEDANLPACCRRGGRHHCALGEGTRDSAAAGRSVAQLAEKCPYPPHSIAATQPFAFDASSIRWTSQAVLEDPQSITQAEANYRIAAGRSHQKRGPPALLL